jgi:two-component system chemotaxis sensor kinase CheA
MDDEQKYLKIFISEAIDILQEVSDDLLKLEDNPTDENILNRLFRSLHTLKGGASLDGLDKISKISHLLEDIFGALRDGEATAKSDYIDLFFEATDRLNLLVNSIGGEYEYMEIDDINEKLEILASEIFDKEQTGIQSSGNGLNLTREQFEKIIHQQGNMYKVTCRFDPNEPMINVNAFVILNNLKPISNFIKSVPDEERMKTETFDKCEIILKTDEDQYIIENRVVTNCKNFSIDEMDFQEIRNLIENQPKRSDIEIFIDDVISDHSNKFIREIESGCDVWLVELNFIDTNPMKGIMGYIIYNNLSARASYIISSMSPEEFKQNPDFEKVLIYMSTKDLPISVIESIIRTNCDNFRVISLSKEDFTQPEEPLGLKQPEKDKKEKDKPTIISKPSESHTAYMEVDKAIVDQVIENIGEVFINLNYLVQIYNRLVESDIKDIDTLQKENEQASRQLNATTVLLNSLMDYAVLLRMVPVKKVFKKFPRIVRDISRKLGKKVLLVIEGERSRIDQEMLEALEAPILHMIRNSLDHGIELPEEREIQGKDPRGTITLRATQLKSHVEIDIIDDGKGMDRDKILDKAVKRGLIDEEKGKNLSDEDIYSFIYHPGFSTSEEVSQISGRGVGMDVVATEVKKVGGKIKIHSEKGKGTKITLKLPITM